MKSTFLLQVERMPQAGLTELLKERETLLKTRKEDLTTRKSANEKFTIDLNGPSLRQELSNQKVGYTFSELTLVEGQPLAKGDAKIPAREAWAACGIVPGVTLVSLADSGPLANPAQISSQFEKILRQLESNQAPSVVFKVEAFGLGEARSVRECTIPTRKAKDALQRDQWTVDFPFAFLGVGVPREPVVVRSESAVDALMDGGKALAEQASTIFTGLNKLVTGSLPLANLGGPIAIARVAGDAAQGGLLFFLLTVSWMSVNIGMFNLLPLPALDGGALLLHGVEAAYGKPLPLSVQANVQKAGVVLILLLFVFVFFNDITRLFVTP
jgi:regulator of sigma E protease